MRMQNIRCGLAFLATAFLVGCSKPPRIQEVAPSAKRPVAISTMLNCEVGAKRVLGPGVAVLKCGELTGSGALEALAVLPLSASANTGDGTSVSRLVVIKQKGSEWETELDADKEIRNPEGYIGMDFTDDSYVSSGYRLRVYDHRT